MTQNCFVVNKGFPFMMKLRFLLCVLVLTSALKGNCQPIPWHDSLAPQAKRLKASDFYDTRLQIDLAEASAKGDTNRLQKLVAQGADVNAKGKEGMRPLFFALRKQNIKGFKFLLESGADPNAVVDYPGVLSPQSVLTLAAAMENPEFLEILLTHGATPDLRVGETQKTAIFSASFYHRTNNIAILLKHGADINARDSMGYTPFHKSINLSTYASALFLYHNGADPLIKNDMTNSAVDTLQQFGGISFTRADKKAYPELIKEFKAKGLLKEDFEMKFDLLPPRQR